MRGAGFVDRGGVFCRFGVHEAPSAPATLHSSELLSCESPAVAGAGVALLALTLNGDKKAFIDSEVRYTYYGDKYAKFLRSASGSLVVHVVSVLYSLDAVTVSHPLRAW